MSLNCLVLAATSASQVTVAGAGLVLLIVAAAGVGAIAVLVGQWLIRWATRRSDSTHDALDLNISEIGTRLIRAFATFEGRQQRDSLVSDAQDEPAPAQPSSAKPDDSSQSDFTAQSPSQQSSDSKVKDTAKRLGQVAKLAHSALSSKGERQPNESSDTSNQATPQRSNPDKGQPNGNISRYERAEKRLNQTSDTRKPEVVVEGQRVTQFASRRSPTSKGGGGQGGHTNGSESSTEKLISVLQTFVASHRASVAITVGLLLADLLLWILPHPAGYLFVEVPVSLGVAIAISWLGSQLFRDFFDGYLLDAALKEGRKLNSEFLILAKFAANGLIILIAVVAFAQTHQINIFGIVASLGIGGLAVAFAAQKTLEQLLGGIVIYLDRPFIVDDYIGLPDGTFGRVESIGLRSTKVRTSGKGTLVVVPNSALTQINIENFTGAKKVMSIVYLNLYRLIPDDEKALIRQVILESTSDIFGIDSRSTDVTFRLMPRASDRTQVQITFFILGSGEVSMELRRQVLDLANQNITQQLLDYGLRFDMEEPTIYVDSPITI